MAKASFYDRAFKEIFSNRRIMRSFLRDIVAERWVSLIDWSSVRVAPSHFVGMGERKREADLLVELGLKGGRRLLIYLLLEFQSTAEPMALRLLEYLLRAYRAQHGAPLSVVVPIVVYNGGRRWKEPVRLMEQFTLPDPALRRFVPDFAYLLVDIGALDEGLLRRLGSEIAAFFLLEKTRFADVEQAAKRILWIFSALVRTLPADARSLLERYIAGAAAHRGADSSRWAPLIYSKSGGGGMLGESLDGLVRKGRNQGRREERAKRLESVRRMLARGFSVADVVDLIGLSEAEVRKLKEAKPARARRSLTPRR